MLEIHAFAHDAFEPQAYRKFKKDFKEGPPGEPSVTVADLDSVRHALRSATSFKAGTVHAGFPSLPLL
jgi:hypothetical protein